MRRFVDEELLPTLHEWLDDTRPPAALLAKMGKAGLLASICGRADAYDYCDEGTHKPEDMDHFHELITLDEICRCGSAPVFAALTNGPSIGLSAIMSFASSELKHRVAPGVLMGRKLIALAISEPQTGSDVAGLGCSARLEGDCFVVNGNKKWITNGMYADYFVTAVKTTVGSSGQAGMSILLIEKDAEGLSRRKIKVGTCDLNLK